MAHVFNYLSQQYRIRDDYFIEHKDSDSNTWIEHPKSILIRVVKKYQEESGNTNIHIDYSTLMQTITAKTPNIPTEVEEVIEGGETRKYFKVMPNAREFNINLILSVIVKFNDVTLVSDSGASADLGDVYAMFRFDNTYPYFYAFRSHIQYSHYRNGYHHSHTRANRFDSYDSLGLSIGSFCTGGSGTRFGKAQGAMYEALEGNDFDGIYDALLVLIAMAHTTVSTESISGGPYIVLPSSASDNRLLVNQELSSHSYKLSELFKTHFDKLDVVKKGSNIGIKMTDEFMDYLFVNHKDLLFHKEGRYYIPIQSRNSYASPSNLASAKRELEKKHLPFYLEDGSRILRTLKNEQTRREYTKYECCVPEKHMVEASKLFQSYIVRKIQTRRVRNSFIQHARQTKVNNIESPPQVYSRIPYTPS